MQASTCHAAATGRLSSPWEKYTYLGTLILSREPLAKLILAHGIWWTYISLLMVLLSREASELLVQFRAWPDFHTTCPTCRL